MIQARTSRNSHRYVCDNDYCDYQGLWLPSLELAERDGRLHQQFQHKKVSE